MDMMRDFAKYLEAVFLDGSQKAFFMFDLLGVILILWPVLGVFFDTNSDLAQKIGVAILGTSFVAANFSLYRKSLGAEPLSEESLLFYPHHNPPHNAAKLLYVGSEIAKNLIITLRYIDKQGNPQAKLVTDFFPREDFQMFWQQHKYDFLEPGQVSYFHLVDHKSTANGTVTVVAEFFGTSSGRHVKKSQDFELKDF